MTREPRAEARLKSSPATPTHRTSISHPNANCPIKYYNATLTDTHQYLLYDGGRLSTLGTPLLYIGVAATVPKLALRGEAPGPEAPRDARNVERRSGVRGGRYSELGGGWSHVYGSADGSPSREGSWVCADGGKAMGLPGSGDAEAGGRDRGDGDGGMGNESANAVVEPGDGVVAGSNVS